MSKHDQLAGGPGTPAVDQFLKGLDTWVELENEVRAGGFKGCPMGADGCPEDAIVTCDACRSTSDGTDQGQLLPEFLGLEGAA